MRYCIKCRHLLDDEMLFCPRCGTKAAETSASSNEWCDYDEYAQKKLPKRRYTQPMQADNVNQRTKTKTSTTGVRKGMKTLSVICGVLALVYVLMAAVVELFILSATGFFVILAAMFSVLSKSPKESPYVLGGILKKTVFVWICIALAFILFVAIGLITGMGGASQTPAVAGGETTQISEAWQESSVYTGTEEEAIEQTPILNVEQFADITSAELVALIGEPDCIEAGTCTGAFEIPCVYYDYDDEEIWGEISFALVNDRVVRFTSYKDGYKFLDKDTVLEEYGVVKGADCVLVGGGSESLRFRCPSESVDDFHVNLIEGNTFGFLQVTYDMQYYEEWYIPLQFEMTQYMSATEMAVESILKAPKTADFPWLSNWTIMGNRYYVIAQSYVDAQNSFGAEIRSDFTFIYHAGTTEVVYAVFDGEVIVDNGYVPTEDLVMQLISEG